MRHAIRRYSGWRCRSELSGSRHVCVLRSTTAWRRSSAWISGSPKSMMDNSRPIRVLLYMPVLAT